MRYNILLASFTAITFVYAAPSIKYSVFEKVHQPEGYVEASTAVEPSKLVALQIHLAQGGNLEEKLLTISDPSHAHYGQHMSRQQVEEMLAPKDSSVKQVKEWLKTFSFMNGKDIEIEGQWIKLDLEVAQVEEMLQTKYKMFDDIRTEDNATKRTVMRTLEYSLPSNLHSHIDMIQPTTMFGMRPHGSSVDRIFAAPPAIELSTGRAAFNATACNTTITPECLAHLYKFDGYTPKANSKLGITGYLEEYAQFDDLADFLQIYAPDKVGNNFTWESINGGLLTQDYTGASDFPDYGEANLDIQYTVGISAPIPNVFYSTAGRPPSIQDLDVHNDSEPYLDFLTGLLAQDKLPETLTTSYGENEQSIPDSYARTVCAMFAQLGARGTSVLFSSGDSGPGWSCRNSDPNAPNKAKFLPQFPASCPWVTSVGGTWQTEPVEQAVFFSSGGFSDKFPMPKYQATQVSHYFRQHDNWKEWAPYFNKTGRGFPDLSGQANKYSVVYNGTVVHYRGTSCSSPMVAAIISLLNSELISRGKKPLGFLNPWLYSRKIAPLFNDITTGRSTGCNGLSWGKPIATDPVLGPPEIIPGAGWDAVVGWDPVTGLGTPDFSKLLAAL